jgi:hypothetical protein
MNCSCCGEVLEEDADGDPYTYGPEEDLCSDCYHDQYKFSAVPVKIMDNEMTSINSLWSLIKRPELLLEFTV